MNAIYESDKLLSEYLLFHFGSAEEILPPERRWPAGMREALHFCERTVRHFGSDRVRRGLDLGCAVGRSTFEMSRHCDEVIGIDFSKSFVDAANALQQGRTLRYERLDEGRLTTPLAATAPEGSELSRVRFEQGDAMNLRPGLGAFARVHAANLLCRLREPRLLLERLPDLVKSGGTLVLATPCTWLEEFTPREYWPDREALPWLKDALEPDFALASTCDEPFLIRETARKFQLTFSLVTVWRRVSA